eukprot:gnl/Chilomastix_caulleri/1220.p1 GENE.gnl/Chilomastix_caulleri/1220~~gnl/Chilomastix_caulleri/1220.p1  ORF type:complete len:235 (+),score=76.42 gnl/Chilomastix_caulleri/1220:98-802(+)
MRKGRDLFSRQQLEERPHCYSWQPSPNTLTCLKLSTPSGEQPLVLITTPTLILPVTSHFSRTNQISTKSTIEAAREAVREIAEEPDDQEECKECKECKEPIQKPTHNPQHQPQSNHMLNTISLTSLAQMTTWVLEQGIPTAFLDVYEDEYEEETDTVHDTLDHPLVLLVDPRGVIRHCILGLDLARLDAQRGALLELVEEAKPTATVAPPKDAPPVSAKCDALGIGSYEYFGVN